MMTATEIDVAVERAADLLGIELNDRRLRFAADLGELVDKVRDDGRSWPST
jgi:hypothetical protein